MFSGTLLSSQHWEGKHPWELTGLLKRLTPRQGEQYPEEHLMLTSDLYHTRPMNILAHVHTLEMCVHFTLLWEQIGCHRTYLML